MKGLKKLLLAYPNVRIIMYGEPPMTAHVRLQRVDNEGLQETHELTGLSELTEQVKRLSKKK